MGQRHQIFLKIKNPVKNKRLFTAKGEKAKAIKAFGSAKFTVLALHHQWLYGRSAAVNLLNVLLYTNPETIQSYTNPFGEDFSIFDGNDTLDGYIKKIMGLLQVQTNLLHPRGIGYERMHFLNDDESDMRHQFTYGDNNDGITIIDTITRKYCMMNISTYGDYKDSDSLGSASCLQPLKPVSAREYMAAYYGETEATIQDYYKDGKTKEEIYDLKIKNIVDNEKIGDIVEEQTNGILTEMELKKIFPKHYETHSMVGKE